MSVICKNCIKVYKPKFTMTEFESEIFIWIYKDWEKTNLNTWKFEMI